MREWNSSPSLVTAPVARPPWTQMWSTSLPGRISTPSPCATRFSAWVKLPIAPRKYAHWPRLPVAIPMAW